jgi:hypothetical protein
LALLLKLPLRSFSENSMTHLIARAKHYERLFHRFSARQIKQIFLDKYDPGYKLRSRFASNVRVVPEPIVLLPSAYGNVSRMAASYARLLPEQSFLLVATRQSAKEFERPPNVQVRDLASYANTKPPFGEIASILERWKTVENELRAVHEFDVLSRAGVFHSFRGWFRNCLRARNAWREVLDREPVSAVLCGDDSNIYTRLPVMLASNRRIPTVDFHHGAMDGRYLLKDLPCDVYLAKNEMERDYLLRVCGLPSERVAIGAATPGRLGSLRQDRPPVQKSIVLFSEPYENATMRAEELYRELLPQLCRVARKEGCGLVIKLHPFESAPERRKLVRALLTDEDHSLVTVIDGPLSEQLLSQTWFGITGESTTVMNCLLHGIPCFLMGWLRLSSYGYVDQYARFGLGDIVKNVDDVEHLPRRLEKFRYPDVTHALWKMADAELLQQWLGISSSARPSVSRVS